MDFILKADTSAPEKLGGKGRALAELSRTGFPVPEWFVVSPDAARRSCSDADRAVLVAAADAQRVLAILERAQPSPEIAETIVEAARSLAREGERLAVRSSAVEEDAAGHSYAGQFESYLFVAPEDVPDKVAEVWRSACSDRVVAYRAEQSLSAVPSIPAVVVQRMIDAEASGVAFGADPVTGDRNVAVVSAVYGLGTSLVSGESDADTYRVDAHGSIVDRAVAEKLTAHRFSAEGEFGVQPEDVLPDLRNVAALTDAQVLEVAELARRASAHFGPPQDIEWAIADGKLYLLQSRPITTLKQSQPSDGRVNLWDNSNITESYSGVTTPLTYSFARRIYEEVYRQFCRIMRVSDARIEAHSRVFSGMIGLIRGRIYYNLLNWYRVLALLPGFRVNRAFMEQMMGVREPLPESVVEELSSAGRGAKAADALNLGWSVVGLFWNYWLLPRRIKEFYRRLDDALGNSSSDMTTWPPERLADHFYELERRLLRRWDAPLVNDFLAMIFYGLLGKAAEKWLGSRELQNDLVVDAGYMISAEPAKRVRQMGALATESPKWVALLRTGSLERIEAELPKHPAFQKEYTAYLEKFGDRCLEELKLESATLHDDPLTLLRSIGNTAGQPVQAAPASDGNRSEKAMQEVESRLAGRPVKKAVFRWILRNARDRVRDRENLRFERTRLFGRVRRIFVELGKRLHDAGSLADPRDVFYLEQEEIFGFIEGTCTTASIRELVATRKREFDGYRQGPPPPDRFETRGMVHTHTVHTPRADAPPEAGGEERRGLGCCAGFVRGKVRVVRDPRHHTLQAGEILVAERTDPGWILLFPLASGLLVERGSLLSHSAIVSRELGIPAIVSVPGVTVWLNDGDEVEFDGATGVVRRIREAEEEFHAQ